MGKTPSALRMTIAVHPDFADHPAVKDLADKGHVVTTLTGYDLILSPHAHYWHERMWTYKGILGRVLADIRKGKRVKKESA